MAERVILLTAAVTPIQSFKGSVRDPQLRLRQYKAALRFWASVADRVDGRVVVVETTGTDLKSTINSLPLRERGRIHAFSHTPTPQAIQNGIGAIEANALDDVMLALATSRTTDTFVAKVTGRLQVGNAVELLGAHDNSTFIVRRTLDRKYADSRFFQVPIALWNSYMTGLAGEICDREGRYFEYALAYRLIRGEYERRLRVIPFRRRPIVEGVSGTSGKRYGGRVSRPLNLPVSWAEHLIVSLGSKQV
jgi:hypothetical protein